MYVLTEGRDGSVKPKSIVGKIALGDFNAKIRNKLVHRGTGDHNLSKSKLI